MGIQFRVNAVPEAGHGGDDPGFAEALAQGRDGDAYGVRERVCVLVPRTFQEFFRADDTTFGGDEHFEHGELLPSERDVAAAAVDLAAERIQTQTSDLPHGWVAVGAPAVECSEPEHELPEFERFREVVVGAEPEPRSLVVEPIGRSEHQDGHAAGRGDDALGDLVTGGPGNVAVEDRDVVGVHAQQLQRGIAVAGDVCGDRFEAKAIADGFGQVGLVLNDQYTRDPMLTIRRISPAYRKRQTGGQHRVPLTGVMTFGAPARTTTRRTPRILIVGLIGVTAAIIGALGYQSVASSFSTAAAPVDVLRGGRRDGMGEADGAVPDGTTVFNDEVPGVVKLDPALLGALRRAARNAADDGVTFVIDSGWRSPAYQEQLLHQAVSKYGSEAEAAQWVATPTTSAHVSGEAVDVGPSDAVAWLSRRGADYGLCQIYGNEPWHYELRPDAIDRGCPRMFADPTHDPRMER